MLEPGAWERFSTVTKGLRVSSERQLRGLDCEGRQDAWPLLPYDLPMGAPIRRVLIYRLGSMGDTVVSLPVFHLVARAFPGAEVRLMTNRPINEKAAAAAAILANTGLVSGYFHYEVGMRGIGPLRRLWWQVVRWRPQVLVYAGSARGVKAARRDAWFFRACGILRQIGVPITEEMQQNLWQEDRSAEEYECARLVRNIAELGDGRLDSRESWDLRFTAAEKARAAEALAPAGERPVLAMSLGTKLAVNHWGLAKWRALLVELGRRYPEYALAITGVAGESGDSDMVAAGWHEGAGERAVVLNLCGKLSPRESAAVFARAKLFLGHDSGPMHLANAAGVPVIGVFSARNSPTRWFPYGGRNRVVYHKVNCHGCGLLECTVEQMKCIRSISVGEVLAEVCAALEDRDPAGPQVWQSDYVIGVEEIAHAS